MIMSSSSARYPENERQSIAASTASENESSPGEHIFLSNIPVSSPNFLMHGIFSFSSNSLVVNIFDGNFTPILSIWHFQFILMRGLTVLLTSSWQDH